VSSMKGSECTRGFCRNEATAKLTADEARSRRKMSRDITRRKIERDRARASPADHARDADTARRAFVAGPWRISTARECADRDRRYAPNPEVPAMSIVTKLQAGIRRARHRIARYGRVRGRRQRQRRIRDRRRPWPRARAASRSTAPWTKRGVGDVPIRGQNPGGGYTGGHVVVPPDRLLRDSTDMLKVSDASRSAAVICSAARESHRGGARSGWLIS